MIEIQLFNPIQKCKREESDLLEEFEKISRN